MTVSDCVAVCLGCEAHPLRSKLHIPNAQPHSQRQSCLTRLSRERGQATVELFLLLPILFSLLAIIIAGFRANHGASERSIAGHVDALKTFDHGLGKIKIDGLEIPPGQIITLIPPSSLDLGDLLGKIGAKVGLDIGLNKLFSKIGFLRGDTFAAGFIKSGATSAANSYVNSGFKEVNWESAAWAGATGGFSSGQASRWFQGADIKASSGRELLGSTLQGGVTGFTGSEGDAKGAAQGAVGGLFGSDTYGGLENGKAGMAWGAAKGGIQSVVTGALDGKIDSNAVLNSAVGGAMGTGQAARVFTMGSYKGDPRQSAAYQGINAGVSSLINGGKAKDAAFAAANGAFYSGQTMGAIGRDKGIMREVAHVGFGSLTAVAQGQNAEGVGHAALQSLATAEASRISGRAGEVTQFLVRNASTVGELKKSLESANAQVEAAKKLTGDAGDKATDEAKQQQSGAILKSVTFSLVALSRKAPK